MLLKSCNPSQMHWSGMFCVKENYKENIQECLKKLWVNMDYFFLLILANKFFPEIAVETVICNGKKASKNHKFRSHQLDKRCITWKNWHEVIFCLLNVGKGISACNDPEQLNLVWLTSLLVETYNVFYIISLW